jgi:enterochelin esterase-like enzyme
MLKNLLIYPLSIFAVFTLCAQQNMHRGTVVASISVHSNIMNRDVKYSVYLPPDYFSAQRRYPVTYLLHGYSGCETDWVDFGEANRIADKMISENTIPDMIIVMPDGRNDFYMNTFDGKVKYEDFFIKELIPHIDSAYQTRPEKDFRGLSGLSMGGFGATLLAIKNPDKFGAVAALSAAYWTDEEVINMPEKDYNGFLDALIGKNLKGKDRVSDHWKKNSILNLLESQPIEKTKSIRWYFDCGDDDFLFEGNALLHVALTKKKIKHEFRMRDGAHTWTYWRTGLPDALKFIGDGFKRI